MPQPAIARTAVSDACQINDFDHPAQHHAVDKRVSDACQINDFDHCLLVRCWLLAVSDACQINDFDHVRPRPAV